MMLSFTPASKLLGKVKEAKKNGMGAGAGLFLIAGGGNTKGKKIQNKPVLTGPLLGPKTLESVRRIR